MLELKIEFEETTGAVNLSGPLENRIMCYGLLEIAKEIIGKQGQAAAPTERPRIVPALGPFGKR